MDHSPRKQEGKRGPVRKMLPVVAREPLGSAELHTASTSNLDSLNQGLA